MRIPLRGSVGRGGGGGRLLYFSWEVGEAKRVFLFHCLLNHFSVDRLRLVGGAKNGASPNESAL